MERAKLYISLISRRFWALEIALRAQKVSALEASQALLNIVAGQMFRYVRSFMYLRLGLLSFFFAHEVGRGPDDPTKVSDDVIVEQIFC